MQKRKILVVFGTRPEAIKLSPVIGAFGERAEEFDCVVAVTAQHRKLLDQVLDLFSIQPDHDLDLMRQDQTLHGLLAGCLRRLTPVIQEEKPDLVVVQGDTTTTFGAAMAAYCCRTPVAHVEAGLRTGNKLSPYPEEVNRRLTSAVSDLHFAPTERNKRNLLAEGIDERTVFVTGNTVVDALLQVRETVQCDFRPPTSFERLGDGKRMILVTGHRRESFGEKFRSFCTGLRRLAERNPDVEIVYPVHLNPNVQQPVGEILDGLPNLRTTGPADYRTFVYLMDRCYFIISDSGGIQEEAPSLGKPVLVTRECTERPEALEASAAKLVGTGAVSLVEQAERLLRDPAAYREMVAETNPFGDGKAAGRIVSIIAQWMNGVVQPGVSGGKKAESERQR